MNTGTFKDEERKKEKRMSNGVSKISELVVVRRETQYYAALYLSASSGITCSMRAHT